MDKAEFYSALSANRATCEIDCISRVKRFHDIVVSQGFNKVLKLTCQILSITLRFMKIALKYWWLWIILISFTAYARLFDNFFAWDDFLWLYRAKTMWADPARIFESEGLYFDPLVYLSFWINYTLFGLDYGWYHLTDVAFHTLNALLVFQFVRLYTRNELSALFSSIIFVSTFSSSDAVLWPSSRVDLFAAFFTLASLILFLKYLRKDKTALYIASIAAYILALGAKGTPLVLPALLLWIFANGKRNNRKHYGIFIPFIFITIAYFFLLRHLTSGSSQIFKGPFDFNFYNYSSGLASLFVPETILSQMNSIYTFTLMYILLFLFWFLKFPSQMDQMKSLGMFFLFLFLAPVLILGNFKVATIDEPMYLLASPSHRIYLASIGMSIFMGGIITGLYESKLLKKELFTKSAAFAILLILMGQNIYQVWQREKIWDMAAKDNKIVLYGLKKDKLDFSDGSIVVVINFPMSRGFLEPMLKVYYDLKEITVLNIYSIPTELPDNPASVGGYYAPFFKGDMLLVMGKMKMYDLSDRFKILITAASSYYDSNDAADRKRYRSEYVNLAAELNQIILKVVTSSL